MKRNVKLFTVFSLLLSLSTSSVKAEITPEEFKNAMEKFSKTEEGQKLLAKTVQHHFERTKFGPTIDDQFESPLQVEDKEERPTLGKEKAPITISIFSDFECPFCKDMDTKLAQILKEYPEQVKIRFMNAPLPQSIHMNATAAAKAAIAAWRQGKFWEMHDALFQNQDALAPIFFVKIAQDLNLDISKFEQDVKSDETKRVIHYDSRLIDKLGATGRPAMLITGPRGSILLRGSKPIEQIREVIDRWLKEIK